MSDRSIEHKYDDPVELVWLRAAADLGLRIDRSSEVFASYDGEGTLTISTEEHFDADDCLAQMIFHEICHWLVAGRRGYQLEDWGLSNVDDRDLTYEYAAIRVQAALSRPHGLRNFMAVTTDWRPYWDALPDDPLAVGDDPAIPLAQDAHHLSRLEPFRSVLQKALRATATISDAVREFAEPKSLWSRSHPRHRLGSLLNEDEDLRCGTCAWAIRLEHGLRCRQHKGLDDAPSPVETKERACERWEKEFTIDDCGSCGACCRQGFDVLAVAPEAPFAKAHPELVQLRDDGDLCVPRPNGLCVALEGDGTEPDPYRCQHYSIRPQNCRDFEVAGDACLVARRRVGMSR